jgi:predicted PurR-regulated permease PerM
VQRLLPARRRPQLKRALESLEPQLRWWTLGSLFNMVVTGITSWAGYALVLGTQQAAPLAVLAALGELIPNIGPMLAFVVALIFAAPQGGGAMLGVTAVYVVLQTVESYILVPMVTRKTVEIPPVVTLFSVVFWGKVFGPVGLLMAIPLNLVVWSFVTNFLGDEVPESAGN